MERLLQRQLGSRSSLAATANVDDVALAQTVIRLPMHAGTTEQRTQSMRTPEPPPARALQFVVLTAGEMVRLAQLPLLSCSAAKQHNPTTIQGGASGQRIRYVDFHLVQSYPTAVYCQIYNKF